MSRRALVFALFALSIAAACAVHRDSMGTADAIALAGGPQWAYAKTTDVRVIRGALTKPQVIPVNLWDVLAGDEKDVYLQPGDIVMVPAKYVTRFDRWITQALAPL